MDGLMLILIAQAHISGSLSPGTPGSSSNYCFETLMRVMKEKTRMALFIAAAMHNCKEEITTRHYMYNQYVWSLKVTLTLG